MGKTALAERLGTRLDATLVIEESDNPFLADFYADRPGAALQAQLFYLLNRHRQQTALRQSDLFSQLTISDYLFDRDKIFAYLNLDDNELFIYQRLYELLARDVPSPDLVVYLQAPTDVLLRRVRASARRSGDRRCSSPIPSTSRSSTRRISTSSSTTTPRRSSSSRPREFGDDHQRRSDRRSRTPDSDDGPGNAVLRAESQRDRRRRSLVTGALLISCPHGLVQEGPHAYRSREGKAEPGTGRPVDQVSGLLADHLQQGSHDQPQRLPEVRPPLPGQRHRTAQDALRRRDVGGARSRASSRPIRCKFTDTKPYKKRLEAERRRPPASRTASSSASGRLDGIEP